MRVAQSWLTEILQRATPDWQVTRRGTGRRVRPRRPRGRGGRHPRAGIRPLVVGRVAGDHRTHRVQEADPLLPGRRRRADGAAGDRLRRTQLRRGRPGRRGPARRRAARRLRDRRSQDLRPGVRRHDLLGVASWASARTTRASWCSSRAPPSRAPTPTSCSVSTTRSSSSNITPDRGYCFSVRGLTRELACGFDLEFADPAVVPALPAEGGEAWPIELQPESKAARFAARRITGIDPKAVEPVVAAAATAAVGRAPDLAGRRRHQLRHARARPAAARLRRREGSTAVSWCRRAEAGEKLTTLDGVERRSTPRTWSSPTTPARSRWPASWAARAPRSHARHHRRPAGGGDLGPARRCSSTRAPAQAAQRGQQALRAGRRPAAAARRPLDRAAALLVEIARRHDRARRSPTSAACPGARRIRMDIDLPDRVAGRDLPERHRRAPAAPDRLHASRSASATTGHGQSGRDPAVVASGPGAARRPGGGGAAARGLEQIPSVLPPAPAGRGLTAAAASPPRCRTRAGRAGYVEVLPSGVPAARGCSTPGAATPTTRAATPCQVLNPLEPIAPNWPPRCCPACWRSWRATPLAAQRDLALYGIAQVVAAATDTKPVAALPVDRRPDRRADRAELMASLPAQPVHVAAVLAGHREPRGPWGPGRRRGWADAIEIARIVGAAARGRAACRGSTCRGIRAGAPSCSSTTGSSAMPASCTRRSSSVRPAGAHVRGRDRPRRPAAASRRCRAPRVSPFPAGAAGRRGGRRRTVPAADGRGGAARRRRRAARGRAPVRRVRGRAGGEGRKSLAFALRFRAADRTLTEDEASAARDAAVAASADSVGAIPAADIGDRPTRGSSR